VSCRFALTKLDILDDQPLIKVGVAYVVNGQKIDYYPSMSTVTSASAARLRIKQQQEMFSNFTTMKHRVELKLPFRSFSPLSIHFLIFTVFYFCLFTAQHSCVSAVLGVVIGSRPSDHYFRSVCLFVCAVFLSRL